MRYETIAIGPAEDQALIRFHPRLTVIGGMDAAGRVELTGLLLGAMAGTAGEVSAARWVDSQGRAIQAQREGSHWKWTGDDGAPCATPLSILALEPSALRRLIILSAADLGVVRSGAVDGESPEIADARATLAAIDAEFADALAMQAKVDALRAEVTEIDQRVRSAETDGARRRYARLLAELERVRIEAASVRGGAAVADADRRFVGSAADVHGLAARWRQARDAARAEQLRFGSRERLDLRTLTEALETPDEVPPELDALAAIYEAAEAQRAILNDRLTALATGTLPKPSHPAVVRLAHADQDQVWDKAHRAVEAARRLENQSLALGGLEAEGVAPPAAAHLETAHDAVDLAERELNRRRVGGMTGATVGALLGLFGLVVSPLLLVLGLIVIAGAATWAVALPARELQRRRSAEIDALQNAGVASYMTFQIRRLEVNIDPKATYPLELAALEYRRALATWRKLAGDLSPVEALALEPETRQYAAALTGSGGTANEIAQLRSQLTTQAEPAVAKAKARLIEACAPFGIDDPELAVGLVRHQASTSTLARLQAAVEAAESTDDAARSALERRLAELGFAGSFTPGAGLVPPDDAEMERRLDSFDEARAAAEARERARANARPAHQVEADLSRLEALVGAESDAAWADQVRPDDTEEPDVDALRERRVDAVGEFESARRHLPDIERLNDRREALARRVAVLAAADGGPAPGAIDATDLEQVLLARLASARRIGPHGESATMILDEPFEYVKGDRKWAVLDAVERLSAAVQLVYLTDDVDVLVWARQRGHNAAISLLEPKRDSLV